MATELTSTTSSSNTFNNRIEWTSNALLLSFQLRGGVSRKYMEVFGICNYQNFKIEFERIHYKRTKINLHGSSTIPHFDGPIFESKQKQFASSNISKC